MYSKTPACKFFIRKEKNGEKFSFFMLIKIEERKLLTMFTKRGIQAYHGTMTPT